MKVVNTYVSKNCIDLKTASKETERSFTCTLFPLDIYQTGNDRCVIDECLYAHIYEVVCFELNNSPKLYLA